MEVEKISKGQIEINIDPRLQEEESTVGPIEELIEVQVDPNELSRVVKISKSPESKQAQQLREFLCRNQDMFAWTHTYMIRIHLEIICHWLNINP